MCFESIRICRERGLPFHFNKDVNLTNGDINMNINKLNTSAVYKTAPKKKEEVMICNWIYYFFGDL